MTEREIMQLLREALAEIQKGWREPSEFSPSLALTGPKAALDSLDVMLFLDKAEELLRQEAGWDVPLVGDEAFTLEPNPFATIQSMSDYIAGLLALGPEQL
ncbi:MAG: hypothetical protein LBC94_02485 [Desulfovibrio sp.]|jgi:hypothetical protein|nr:hypothetical protein [Desulfovibrio sp.]